MKIMIKNWYVSILLSVLCTSAYGQNNVKDIDGCLCYYLNRLHQHDNYLNYGLYDTSILKDLNTPSNIVQDSILFFSPLLSKRLLLEQKIAQYHLYDVPDFAYANYTMILKMMEKEQRDDTVQMINNIVSSSTNISGKYNFDIVSWMDRRPAFNSPKRISKKKGIYIKCRHINGTWYMAKYPTFKSKLADLELSIIDSYHYDEKQPDLIKQINGNIRISCKDSMTIAYPIKLK